MTDSKQDQAKQLTHQLRTRHVPASSLGPMVAKLLKLGVSVMVLKDTNGAWSLGTAYVVAMVRDTVTIEFDRLRPLAVTEVTVARNHGAGVFEPPTPPQEVPGAG